ncbi:unnamed protein product, partial [marine sediment metagenome]
TNPDIFTFQLDRQGVIALLCIERAYAELEGKDVWIGIVVSYSNDSSILYF